MKKSILHILLCALVITLLMPSAIGENDEEKLVMTSFYPVYILAQNVLSDIEGVRVQNLTAPTTGCLHDYQLLAGDVRALAGADALIINGAGMERYLDTLTDSLPALPVIDCSAGITLLPDAHEGEMNAHIWLDADNAAKMVENMREQLCLLFPDAADKIAENAAEYAKMLRELDDEIRQSLASLPSRDIVTFHEAFPYFAKAYGLNVVAVVVVEADEALSPRRLANVVSAVREHGNPPLFTEPQYVSDAAAAIHNETGAPIHALDPLVTGNGSMTAYQDVMRENARALIAALNAE